MQAIKPIHPFPARMAAEIALDELASLRPNSLVLDPMAGSGMALRAAAEQGHRALGFDMDPLAVLMARVWTTPIDAKKLREEAAQVVVKAKTLSPEEAVLPWLDGDHETKEFIDYWFAEPQQRDLRQISRVLLDGVGPVTSSLRIALSRTIVTKERGASLARDVSHGRPHRVMDYNDYDVFGGFLKSTARLAALLEDQPPPGRVEVRHGDARKLSEVETGLADAVITSPPYLNAIDYLRGHRLALVWLGHRLADLRTIRSESIGSERAPSKGADTQLAETLMASLGSLSDLPRNIRRMIERYALDLSAMVTELARVLRPGGKAVLVIGNSTLRSVFVENSRMVSAVAEIAGLELIGRHERALPPSRRYLPPPKDRGGSHLEKRMRTETVLTYLRP